MGVTAIAGVSTRNGGKGPRDRPARPRPPYAVAPSVLRYMDISTGIYSFAAALQSRKH